MSESRPSHIGILAIGSEILEGQIADTNSKTLSALVSDCGGQVDYHISCRDNRNEILSSLEFLSSRVSYIISIGGLGPTTDDMTRMVLADFGEMSLVRNEESLSRVTSKLSSRGVELLEGHKRQADFPQGARIFENKAGTADGFYFETPKGIKILVLPGPPLEIQSILESGARDLLLGFSTNTVARKKYSMAFLGLGESQLAKEVEKKLPEYEDRIGYRASAPFLELKIWLTDKEWLEVRPIWSQIKDQFKGAYICPTILDFESRIISRLKQFRVLKFFLQDDDFDHIGTLFEQYFLPSHFSMELQVMLRSPEEMVSELTVDTGELAFKIIPNYDDNSWNVEVYEGDRIRSLTVSHQMLRTLKNKRASRYLLAMILDPESTST